MRRLPIYFLVDVSESMVGIPIEQVQDGIAKFVNELQKNPYCLETCYISVITYNDGIIVLSPLTPIYENCLPQISIGLEQNVDKDKSTLDDALGLLARIIDKDVARSTVNRKGDWKPIVYILTDGKSNWEWGYGLSEYQRLQLGQSIVCLTCDIIKQQTLEKLFNVTDCIVSLNDKCSQILADTLKSLYCNDVVIGETTAWKKILAPILYPRFFNPFPPINNLNDELPPPPPEEINLII